MIKPKVAILKAEGTNFDEETVYAFNLAGGNAEIVLMSDVLKSPKLLRSYSLIDFPGGFSYGDDLYSGKIWANEIIAYCKDEIDRCIKRGGLVIGVCNGFQVLVRAGILPGYGEPNEKIGLIYNEKNKFECRWINIRSMNNKCVFLKKDELTGTLTVEHGEGRFIVKNEKILQKLIDNQQIVFQYINQQNSATMNYPDNPNGSVYSIAGICDRTGQVLGMMPHPEHFMMKVQHPNWRRAGVPDPFGIQIYKKAISFLKEN